MNQKSKAMLVQLGIIFSKQVNELMIKLYESALEDLGDREIEIALVEWLKTKNRFPTPADVRDVSRPEMTDKNIGIEISSRIIQAISKFGSHQSSNAKYFLGELGWQVVERQGGWQNLCSEVNEKNRSIVQAQMRDLAETLSIRNKIENRNENIQLENKESILKIENLISGIGEIEKIKSDEEEIFA